MADQNFTDLNNEGSAGSRPRQQRGITISYAAALILVLLSVCLSVLVGLLVHLASPKPTVTSGNALNTAELKGRCLELIAGGDRDVCAVCSTKSVTPPVTLTTPTVTDAQTVYTTSTPTTTPQMIDYRLPASVIPHHYELKLQPNIYDDAAPFTFNGTVSITVNVTEKTSNIRLHQNGLTISDVLLKAVENRSSQIPRINNTSYISQFYIINLDGELDSSRSYELSMTFNGKMSQDFTGWFNSSYEDESGTVVYAAVTHFEAVYARKVFPCFDEPAMKATFDVTLVRRTDTGRSYRTLATTEIIGNYTWGEYVADVYATTPVMSTCLLAFAVCDFVYYENRTSNITYRTIVRQSQYPYLRRAQQYGVDIFDWLESTFDPNYPMSKLGGSISCVRGTSGKGTNFIRKYVDKIQPGLREWDPGKFVYIPADNLAIPSTSYGAVENWGLNVFTESFIHSIPGVTDAENDDLTLEVIGHEITHQWFGNLVTPKWWSLLWMKEGLATFWSNQLPEILYPKRRMMEKFIVVSGQTTMVADDGSRSSKALTREIQSNDDMMTLFVPISYYKGAWIFRMADFIMGRSSFINGLNLYLGRYQYRSVDANDLWDSLSDSTKGGTFINMSDIMDPWVRQPNFPLLTVRVIGPGRIYVTQERFLNNMSEDTSGDSAIFRWTIPITIASSTEQSNFRKQYRFQDIAWLDKTQREAVLEDTVIPDPAVNTNWIVVNFLQTGYYIVNYADANWLSLIQQLNTDHTVFPPLTRAQILHDSWTLQKAGRVKAAIALRCLNFLKYDVDYLPWKTFAQDVSIAVSIVNSSNIRGAFWAFMKDTATLTYRHWRMNITMATNNVDIFQIVLGADYACQYGVEECREDSLQLYRDWMVDEVRNKIDPNLRDVVLCNGIRYGGFAEWNFAYQKYKLSTDGKTKSQLLTALACTSQTWILQRMLEDTLNNGLFASEDSASILKFINLHHYGQELISDFVQTNFQSLKKRLGLGVLSEVILSPYRIHKASFLSEVEDFKKKVHKEKNPTSYTSAIDTAVNNLNWWNKNKDVVITWLQESGYGKYLI